MLVLTRKRTEMIKIGDDIVITVIHTSRGSVKLGIQAPSDVRVLRGELNDRAEDAHHDDVHQGPVYSADRVAKQFNAEYVAELEDQVLVTLAK
ncbi:MAG TPA: carbon storage regulator [Schlesneria sp.]|jgi:carbon storage regulator